MINNSYTEVMLSEITFLCRKCNFLCWNRGEIKNSHKNNLCGISCYFFSYRKGGTRCLIKYIFPSNSGFLILWGYSYQENSQWSWPFSRNLVETSSKDWGPATSDLKKNIYLSLKFDLKNIYLSLKLMTGLNYNFDLKPSLDPLLRLWLTSALTLVLT